LFQPITDDLSYFAPNKFSKYSIEADSCVEDNDNVLQGQRTILTQRTFSHQVHPKMAAHVHVSSL